MLLLAGIYTHEGHAYGVQGKEELNKLSNEVAQGLANLNTRYAVHFNNRGLCSPF